MAIQKGRNIGGKASSNSAGYAAYDYISSTVTGAPAAGGDSPAQVAGGISASRLSLYAFTTLATITTLSGAVLVGTSNVSADNSVETDVSVTVSAVCNFAGSIPTGGEHTATITPGLDFTGDIGTTNMKATCNDSNGYDIYAVGYSNNEWKNTNLVGTSSNIATHDYSSTYKDTSYWSMKLTPGTGDDAATIVNDTTTSTNYANYVAVPGDYTKVATKASATTATDISSDTTPTAFTTTYGAYATTSQPSGTYTGQVKYTLVHPNGAEAPEAKDPGPCDNINSEYCMQDASEWADSVASGQTVIAVDARDGQEYKVARLADGKLWMTTNLNLAGGTALSANNTDVTSEYISGFTTQDNLTKDGNTIILPASSPASTSVSGYYTDDAMAYLTNSGNTTCANDTPCYSYYSWIAATLGGKQANGSTAQTSNGHNAAASICPKGWKLPTSTTSNGNVQQSNRWKTGDWYALMTAYGANLESSYYQNGSNTFYNNAGPNTTPNFLLAGRYSSSGSFGNGGSRGLYWSSTSYDGFNAYEGYFNSSSAYSANFNNRRVGYSVRCLFSE